MMVSGAKRRQTAPPHAEEDQMYPGFRLRTQKEAASCLRMSLRQFQRLERRGEGPPRTMLGDRRVGYTDVGLASWIERRTASMGPK